jgi:hypothetical protein
MKYEEALSQFSKYYIDRCNAEFPAIFGICEFKGKSVLEVGPAEGYFSAEASKIARVKTTNVSERLPFKDGKFDIAISRWEITKSANLESTIKEMCRVTKQSVVIVVPSEEGDETKILEKKHKDKTSSRKMRVLDIRRWLEECGLKVKEERRMLKFAFPDINEAIDIFSALGFQNKLSDSERSKLRKFLSSKKENSKIIISQGAAFICGTR